MTGVINLVTGVINAFLLTYVALLPIMNPIGSTSIYLAMTQRLSAEVRRDLPLRIAVNAFCLLIGAIFLGSYVLQFFGITLPVVRIGGGLVILAFAWKMLNQNDAAEEKAKETGDHGTADPALDAFYPLTMPITVGPGSIAVAIALGSERPRVVGGWQNLLQQASGAVAGALALAATFYVCYRFADQVVAALGTTAVNIMTRLMAFIMLCIGIQIIWTGYSALIQ